MSVPNVARYLSDWAGKTPNRTAIIEPNGRTLTFGGLETQIAALTAGLASAGVMPGDRMLLLVPMSIPLYLALIALFRGRHTAVLLDPSAPKVNDTLSTLDLRGFIGSPMAHLLRLKMKSLRGLDLYLSTGFTLMPHRRLEKLSAAPVPIEDVDAELPALLTFTTGSTGTPKAVARTHGFLRAQHNVLAEHMELGSDDIDLPTLPVFLLNSLAAGATCVLPDTDLRRVGDVKPAPVIRQLKEHKCTVTSGSPAFYIPIARALREAGDTLPDLRKVFTGGARVPPSLLEDLVKVAPNAHVEVLYGSTEAEPISRLDARVVLDETAAAEVEGKGSCVGFPVPGIEVRIESTTEIGEILVAGDHVNPRYFRNPEADAQFKLEENGVIWHRTGDTGYFDDQGRLWLVGRVKDMVGDKHPFMIEGPVEALPWVARAAFVEADGAAVLAVTTSDDPPAGWADALKERFGADVVLEVADIPVDPRHNAKIDRVATRRMLQMHPAVSK